MFGWFKRAPKTAPPSNPHAPFSEAWLEHQAQHGLTTIDRLAAQRTLVKLTERREDEARLRRIVREEVEAHLKRIVDQQVIGVRLRTRES